MTVQDQDRAGVAAGGWQFQSVSQPDGVSLRLGRWGGPGRRGTVLMLTGRCEALEKYAEQAADWVARGFGVVALDWRGQGGSSRLLPDPHKGHIDDFATYLDDLERMLPRLVPDDAPRPLVGFAHSMGGHILLRFVLERAHPLAAVILSAPMLGIAGPIPEPLIRHLAARAVARGQATDWVWGQAGWDPVEPRFHNNALTSDPRRFLAGHAAYTGDPALALGGVTWGWLDAAFRSMDHLLRLDAVEACRLPVLMLTAGADRIVRVDRQGRLARRLGNARQHLFPGARHELMMEADAIREKVWRAVDEFLEQLTCDHRSD